MPMSENEARFVEWCETGPQAHQISCAAVGHSHLRVEAHYSHMEAIDDMADKCDFVPRTDWKPHASLRHYSVTTYVERSVYEQLARIEP